MEAAAKSVAVKRSFLTLLTFSCLLLTPVNMETNTQKDHIISENE